MPTSIIVVDDFLDDPLQLRAVPLDGRSRVDSSNPVPVSERFTSVPSVLWH